MTLEPEMLTGLGAALSIFLSAVGAAWASSHAGIFAVRGHSMKAFLPIIISGVLAIYGIIISILLVGKLGADAKDDSSSMSQTEGYRYLSAGLTVGLACLASGLGLAKFIQQLNEQQSPPPSNELTEPLVGHRTVAAFQHHEPPFIKTFLVMTFLEAIGLYGLIVALFLVGK